MYHEKPSFIKKPEEDDIFIIVGTEDILMSQKKAKHINDMMDQTQFRVELLSKVPFENFRLKPKEVVSVNIFSIKLIF